MSSNTAEDIQPGLVDPDLELSHAYLNFLNSGFQGRFAFLNILKRLNYSPLDEGEIDRTRNSIAQISSWITDLWQGGALINHNWKKPETFPAKQAVELLDSLQADYRGMAFDLMRTFEAFDSVDENNAAFLVATYGWFAYSRDNYTRGFVEYGKRFGLDGVIAEFEEHLQVAEADVQYVHEIMQTASEPGKLQDRAFLDELYPLIILLPGAFLCNVHDAGIILSSFDGEFTYAHSEIHPDVAPIWEELGATAEEAGYWAAHNFEPGEAVTWKTYGVIDYNNASAWKLWGFTPENACQWVNFGFGPEIAKLWTEAGYDAERVHYYFEKGFHHPDEVPDYLR